MRLVFALGTNTGEMGFSFRKFPSQWQVGRDQENRSLRSREIRMDWWHSVNWYKTDWITPLIHAYAGVVFVLTLLVLFIHQTRLLQLVRRVGTIAAQIEGRALPHETVPLDRLTGLVLHLGDVVERRTKLNLAPVLEFIRKEERQRSIGVVNTLVNVTETMIELFPMLGIFGTVWAISGVNEQDFTSGRLLVLFGIAVRTTLWGLVYLIGFRIAYSALVFGKVIALEEHNRRFQDFLGILERRSGAVDLAVESLAAPLGGSG
jgi:hypothetical protein